jgi:hypothetical protein
MMEASGSVSLRIRIWEAQKLPDQAPDPGHCFPEICLLFIWKINPVTKCLTANQGALCNDEDVLQTLPVITLNTG